MSRVLQWAERQGFADVPALVALRASRTDHAIESAITWAEDQQFFNIATALGRALSPVSSRDGGRTQG
jgi:hypothetical protein